VTAQLGFGCAALGGYDYGDVDDRDGTAAIAAALDMGVTFFDTADVYGFGRSERVLGRALGPHRHDVCVATKIGLRWDARGRVVRDLGSAYIRTAVDASLRRLGLDALPLCQVHWPDSRTPLGETFSTLADLRRAGKVLSVGCCNVNAEYVETARAFCPIDTVQVPFSVIERSHMTSAIDVRQRTGTRVIAYNVLGRGVLTGKYTPGAATFSGSDTRPSSVHFSPGARAVVTEALALLEDAATRHQRSVAQIAIGWALTRPYIDVALTGAKTPQQVRENAGAGHPLAAEVYDRLEQAISPLN